MILAVYGTLRRGGPANGMLRGAKWLGLDKIRGCLYNLTSFPALRLSCPENQKVDVLVDLYELPDGDEAKYLATIDRYEGYYPEAPDQCLYLRREVTTLEKKLPVTVYEYRFAPVAPTIQSGDWLCE